MKNLLLIILISFFATELSAQNILDVGLTEKSLIVYEKPAKPKLPFSILYEKDFFYRKSKSDSLNVRELISKIDTLEIDYSKWTKSELKKRIIVSKGKRIDIKKEMHKMSDKPKAEQKKLKKEIKGLNNNKSEWRNYPLSISRPIMSNDGKMALITIIRGNSGGSTELYKMENGEWKYFENLERWAY
ncbi:hypothetical protein [Tenacibaculum sp. M341]|uniref:hypothetical protein n=1 Tax=Tenacibaculum sp. M341 TaxID=2530339 RepID=UPI00104806E4|nr:hypothetical protein [Tenacibaculum sp. M341]TCI90612.1 hypothetical protein EYW44_12860 [Tenacibaculum sp. M341]